MGMDQPQAAQSAPRCPDITKLGNHNLGIIADYHRLNLTGPMDKKPQLSIQFNRQLAKGSSHFRIENFIPLDPLFPQTLQGLQLMGF